ncbi:MAG: DUF1925 domain-containing protein [Spirochaetaceae bacterium]|jgi:hypothetical protein|nr:DUF1925 domain-containing protein [Spirochaetaceae bacterium]
MESKQSVIIGFNHHLSLKAPEKVFKKVYNEQIKPFFQILYDYPQFPLTIHFSGVLLERIEDSYGEFFMLLKDLIKRKQIEFIGGGFYEPALPLLQAPDRIDQIEMLTTYIRKKFNKRINGCWIPDLVWEQSIVNSICRAGLTYSFVNEARFVRAGLKAQDYNLPCVCEEKSKSLTVFPVFSSLNEPIHLRGIQYVLDKLIEEKKSSPFVRVIFPDFCNETPDWLKNFFETLKQYEDKIKFSLPGAEMRESERLARVYFSDSMWKNCLIEHPESTYVYSKMFKIKSMITNIKNDKEKRESIKEELLKAQDYSLFCYDDIEGKIPGIYNVSLRNAAWNALLQAERMARNNPVWQASLVALDINFDGILEYSFQSEKLNGIVRRCGAALFELDYLPACWNYQCTLTLPGSPVFENEASFFDTIAAPDSAWPDDSSKEPCRVPGLELWQQVDMDRVQKSASFELKAKEGPFGALKFLKQYKLSKKSFMIKYLITNTGGTKLDFKHFLTLNLSFFSDASEYLRIFSYKNWNPSLENNEKQSVSPDNGEAYNIDAIDFEDLHNELVINFSCNEKFDVKIERVCAPYRDSAHDINNAYQWTHIIIRQDQSMDSGAAKELMFNICVRKTA